jgi:hypothetical protein
MCDILLLTTVAKKYMTNILVIADIILNWTYSLRDVYPVEGPMLKAAVAP